MLISWNDHFALGIEATDAGHGLVIEAINQLNEATTAEQSARAAARLLPRLRQHLAAQFEAEAALMADLPATTRIPHEAEHRRMIEVLDTLAVGQAAGGDVSGLLLLNLVCFLVSHLRATDGDTFAAHRFQAAA